MYYDDPTGATGPDGTAGGGPEDSSSVDTVIAVALHHFAELGFHDTKLEKIATVAGMSKRMLHYHFGDKKGLYRRCLIEAFEHIHPTPEDLDIDSAVPVEGIRRVVEAIYDRMVEHPDAVRILSMESLHDVLNMTELSTLDNHSEVLLHLDRLLMIGQDAGAFRPGICGEDLFLMIWSLTFFRVSQRDIMVNIFHVDTTNKDNTAGIRRMLIDATLAFLTSNLPSSGHRSYLVVDQSDEDESRPASIYEDF